MAIFGSEPLAVLLEHFIARATLRSYGGRNVQDQEATAALAAPGAQAAVRAVVLAVPVEHREAAPGAALVGRRAAPGQAATHVLATMSPPPGLLDGARLALATGRRHAGGRFRTGRRSTPPSRNSKPRGGSCRSRTRNRSSIE